MKIIVTGSSGFIGTAVRKALEQAGHDVLVWDIAVDCNRDVHCIISLAEEKPDIVIHLAGMTDSTVPAADMTDLNIEGTMAVITACQLAKVKKLIFASSCAVYGAAAKYRVDEQTPCAPLNIYSATKHIGELLIKASGLNYVIFRMFNVAGAGCRHDPPRYIIPRAIEAAKDSGFILRVCGALADERDYVHIDDVADAYVKALSPEVNNEIFNIGTGTGTSLETIIEHISLYMGHPVNFIQDNSVQGLNSGVPIITANIDKAIDKLKWQPRHNTGECIVDAVNEYKQTL
jgi:UDP-glucose 4-epimerase